MGSEGHDLSSPIKSSPGSCGVRRTPASGTETEEEAEGETKLRCSRRKHQTQPMFILGPDRGAVSMYTGAVEKNLSADSSFSEQAWDSYQVSEYLNYRDNFFGTD